MELDDLDAPSQVPSRVSRFAPKSSKLKPKQKLETIYKTEAPESSPKTERQELDSVIAKKKEEAGIGERVPSTFATTPKFVPSATNRATKMDVEPKPEGGDESKQDDPMDEDTAEDVVVREIDVFFTPSIGTDTLLYVFQYPLRQRWRPYELEERCQEVRLEPESTKIEMDLSIDTESKNYDQDFGSRINMTKLTLSTEWKVPFKKNIAVGFLMGNKLHLHPIHDIAQLRPSLEHLDSGGSKRKNITSTSHNATIKNEESNEEKTVTPLKKQNKQMGPSIEHKSDTDQYWVSLKYHGSKSDISSRYLQQMVSHESSQISFTMDPYDYLSSLCPGRSNNSTKSKVTYMRSLLPFPVEERLKKLLTEGPPLHSFSATKHFAPEYSEEQLLEFLQKHAILVQGLWAPKSAFLPLDGIENLARDVVLLRFSKNLKVQASQLNYRNPLLKKIKTFLDIFGVQKSEDWKSIPQPIVYWKFRGTPDKSFMKLYPSVVAKQLEVLEAMEQNVLKAVDPNKGEAGKNNAVAKISQNSNPRQPMNSDKQATGVITVQSGRKTMSNDAQQAMPSALKKVLQTHKVCSLQLIRQQLRAMALAKASLLRPDPKMVVAAREGHDAPMEELQAALSEVASNIHGCYVLKSSQDEPFRDVVIEMFRGSEPNAKLKKAEITEAAKKILKREVGNNEYCKVMTELCVSKGSAWVLRSGDGSKELS